MPHNIMTEMQVLSSSPFHAISEIKVYISPNTRDREIYKVGTTKQGSQWADLYGIAKIGLDRLLVAAGIEELDSHAEQVQERLWYAKWAGKYTQPDGKDVPLSGEKSLDLRIGGTRWAKRVETELDKLLKTEGVKMKVFTKAGYGHKKGGDWVNTQDLIEFMATLLPERIDELNKIAEALATRYVTQAAQFGLELAQTGARHRAVRTIMQLGQYTAKDLKEPFIVVRSRFDMDAMREALGPEMVKNMLAAQAAQALGLPSDVIQRLLSERAPQPVAEDLNGDAPMELEEEPVEAEIVEEETQIEAEEDLPETAPEEAVGAEKFSMPITQETMEWIIEHHETAQFNTSQGMLMYLLDKPDLKELTEGEGLNVKCLIKEVASVVKESDTAKLRQVKNETRTKLRELNEKHQLWEENDESAEQLSE